MFKIKKSQGMPMNLIIIVVMLLAVLIIVLGLFRSHIFKFSEDLKGCSVKGAVCISDGNLNAECTQKKGIVEGTKCKTLPTSKEPDGECCVLLPS